ncbi:MAG: CHAT domain-containing protein [Saprospiraceae bacterium]|nr:CHAT domain-containing protein [Saprospiraceae bacterium]
MLISNLDFTSLARDSAFLRLADLFHSSKGAQFYDTDPAISRIYYTAAGLLRKHFYQSESQFDVHRAVYNQGMSYLNELDYIKARILFDSIINQNEKVKPSFYYKAMSKKILTLYQMNEIKLVYEMGSRVLKDLNNKIISDYGCEFKDDLHYDFETFVDILNNFSTSCSSLKLDSVAITKLLEAINLGNDLLQDSDKPKLMGQLLNFIGISYLSVTGTVSSGTLKNKYVKQAEVCFLQSQNLLKQAGDFDNLLAVWINLSSLYEFKAQYELGAEYTRKGLALITSQHLGLGGELYDLNINLGTNLYRQGKINEALDAYTSCLLYLDSSASKNVLPNLNAFKKSTQSSLVLLGSIGRARLRLAQDSLALLPYANAAYDTLFALINDLRANLINDDAKMLLAKQSQEWLPDAFEDIKQLYYLSNDSFYLEQAFKIAEQGKAFALLEASRLNNASALLSKDLQNDQEELSQIELKAVSGSDSLKQLADQKKMAFLSKLKKDAPEYFSLKYKGPETNVRDIQKELIDSNQAILQYFVQEDRLNVFVITKDLFALDTIPIRKDELYTLIDQFYSNINPENEQGTVDPLKIKNFIAASNVLYQNLLGKTIQQYNLPERLIIIPDGRLNELSFDALLCKVDGAADDLILQAKNHNYLVQNKTISYCFSVSLLQEMKHSSSNSTLSQKLALFAPIFQKESTLLPFMRNQEAEIKSIQAQVPDSKLSPESNKEEFLEASQKYKYLHLCAHGFVSQNPDQSFVAFRQNTTMPDTSQFFYLRELYHHKLNQDLITLTACETAVGELKAGEGNISMARGFAYAGVKAFITTLWKIQTNGAAQIIPVFINIFSRTTYPRM